MSMIHEDTNAQHRKAVDQSLCHVCEEPGMKYVLHWYGYESTEDTIKPSYDIP